MLRVFHDTYFLLSLFRLIQDAEHPWTTVSYWSWLYVTTHYFSIFISHNTIATQHITRAATNKISPRNRCRMCDRSLSLRDFFPFIVEPAYQLLDLVLFSAQMMIFMATNSNRSLSASIYHRAHFASWVVLDVRDSRSMMHGLTLCSTTSACMYRNHTAAAAHLYLERVSLLMDEGKGPDIITVQTHPMRTHPPGIRSSFHHLDPSSASLRQYRALI